MPRLVISTVGTSLLTNQIHRSDPKDWEDMLQKSANLTQEQISQSCHEVLSIINQLEQRAKNKLNNGNTLEIRDASAELNGIYGLYDEQLESSKRDHHFLITTDTKQGQVTANIVKSFILQQKKDRKLSLEVEVYTPEKLSTANNKVFNQGIDNLLDWLDRRANEYKEKNYEIYFNLVGGFKALQGCMNTIGMFYADKIIYVFEGAKSNLITIPRLPITVDYSRLTDHVSILARLDAGAGLSLSQTEKVPEAMVAGIDGKMTLSNWGQLIWNQCKDNFLSQELQEFPRLSYEHSFIEDYKNISTAKEKVKLQKTLAKVSYLLEESNCNIRALAKPVSYYAYGGTEGIDHFYVGMEWRVSCKMSNIKLEEISKRKLELRHYGTHKYVERKEGI
ncbi:putative CRISPR-associated protein [Coleofasciculus sp. H7-2]|uniref:putative CRISPR-associated protein n=1 Tax=Coleofasciculus sp. H7-2 TaxID=3351545 RepID=UPI00366DA4F4